MRRGTSSIHALIAIDKQTGMTSHDVVGRVRRAVGEKRVGHAGTLDPDASGVLVVGIGQGTRLMGLLTAERKSYVARISFGTQTSTDDAEGEVVYRAEVPQWVTDSARAQEYLNTLVGTFDQMPPAYSAISVNGVRAYSLARAGQAPELNARSVTIYSAQLLATEQAVNSSDDISWLCSFEVSKGCYIRSIARDLGQNINSAAHISALQRTSSGLISLADCITLEELANLDADALLSRAINPVKALGLPVYHLTESECQDVCCGKRLDVASGTFVSCNGATLDSKSIDESSCVSLVYGQKLYGIWKRQGTHLVCSTNFPAGIVGVRS